MSENIFCSVIIPTYNTDRDGLIRLVDSLDNQTISQDLFEVIFVDDGSTDGLPETLRALVSSKANYKLIEMSNTGWPSAPRNRGTSQAAGEFVLYMDHDDQLFPEIMQRAYELNFKDPVDIITLKEVRTHNWGYGSESVFPDSVNGHEYGVKSLLPLSPHKFYRKRMLDNHSIRFIEGRRVMWEDLYFNLDMYIAGARIGIIHSYPGYHWTNNEKNSSDTYRDNIVERYTHLQYSLEYIAQSCLDEQNKMQLLQHWYATKCLNDFSGYFLALTQGDKVEIIFRAQELAQTFISKEIASKFSRFNQLKHSILLESADPVMDMTSVALSYKAIAAISHSGWVEWVDGKLQVTYRTASLLGGRPYRLVRNKSGVYLPLKGRKTKFLPKKFRLLSEWEGLNSSAIYRGRFDRQVWRSAESTQIQRVPGWFGKNISERLELTLDIANFHSSISHFIQPWDLAIRTDLLIHSSHFAIRARRRFVGACAFIEGVEYVAYKNASRKITVDVNGNVKSLLEFQNESKIAQSRCNCEDNSEFSKHFELSNTHVWGNTPQKIKLFITSNNQSQQELDCKFVTDSGKLHLCVDLTDVASDGDVSLRRGDKLVKIARLSFAIDKTEMQFK